MILLVWTNVKLVLDQPDPDYDMTQAIAPGVDGEITTADGGRTWISKRIRIPEHNFKTD